MPFLDEAVPVTGGRFLDESVSPQGGRFLDEPQTSTATTPSLSADLSSNDPQRIFSAGQTLASTAMSMLDTGVAAGNEMNRERRMMTAPDPIVPPKEVQPDFMRGVGEPTPQTGVDKPAVTLAPTLRGTVEYLSAPFLPLEAAGEFATKLGQDIISKITGDERYGGNLKAWVANPEMQSPAERFISESAKDAPTAAWFANIGKQASEMSPMLGMGAVPGIGGRLISAGFAGTMGLSIYDSAKELNHQLGLPPDQQDAGLIAQLKATLVTTGVFGALAATHATTGVGPIDLGKMGLEKMKPVEGAKTTFNKTAAAERVNNNQRRKGLPELPEDIAVAVGTGQEWNLPPERKVLLKQIRSGNAPEQPTQAPAEPVAAPTGVPMVLPPSSTVAPIGGDEARRQHEAHLSELKTPIGVSPELAATAPLTAAELMAAEKSAQPRIVPVEDYVPPAEEVIKPTSPTAENVPAEAWSGNAKVPSDYRSLVDGSGKLLPPSDVSVGDITVTEKADAKTVEAIKSAIRNGEDMPPPVVERDAEGLFVVDGHARLQAAKELGYQNIRVREYGEPPPPPAAAPAPTTNPAEISSQSVVEPTGMEAGRPVSGEGEASSLHELTNQEWQDQRHVLRRLAESTDKPDVKAWAESELAKFARTHEEQIAQSKTPDLKPAQPSPVLAGEKAVDVGAATLARHGVKEGDVVTVQLSQGGKAHKATVIGAAADGKIEVQFPKQGGPVSARGQRRIIDPLKTNLALLKSTQGTRARAEALKPLQGSERVSNNKRERAFDDAVRHDPEFDPPSAQQAEAVGSRAEGISEQNRKMDARRAAFRAIGLPEESAANPVAVANALPKIRRYISKRDASGAKLAEGVNQGDLIASTQREDLSLTGGTAQNLERIAAEKKAKSDARQAAADFEAQNQQQLFGQGPGARTGSGIGARQRTPEPEPPESYEGTGLKHAIDELERIGRGFKERTPQDRQKMAEAWERTGRTTTPEQRRQLANELAKNPQRGLTGDESAMILRHKVEVINALNSAAERTYSADPEVKLEAQKSVLGSERDLENILDAVAARGSEWGREGRWRQALAYDDFSFEHRAAILRAKKGEALSHEEIEKLRQQTNEDSETIKNYEDYIVKLETKYREQGAQEVIDKIQVETEKELPFSKKILDLATRIIDDVKKEWKNSTLEAEIDFELAALETKIPQGPGARTRPGAASEPPLSLLDKLARVGAIRMMEGKEDFAAWSKSMLDRFGPKLEPMLEQVHDLATKVYHDKLAQIESKRGKKSADAVRQTAAKPDPAKSKQTSIEKIKEAMDAQESGGEFTREQLISEVTPEAKKLAKLAAQTGARGWRAIADAVHKELRAAITDLDFHETLDMISGYGKFKSAATEEIAVALSKAKAEMQTVRKLQDVIAKEPMGRTGFQRQTASDTNRRLISILGEAKKKFGVVVTDPARQLQSALDTRKRFYDNRIKDLEHEIKTRQKIVRERNATPTDPALEAKIAEYRKLKTERDEIFKAELTPEQQMKVAIRAMERSATEYQRRREAGEFTRPAKEDAAYKTSPEYQAAEARRDAEKAAFEELQGLDEAFQRENELHQLETREAGLQKMLQAKEQRLVEGPPDQEPQAVNRPETPRVESLLQRIRELDAKIKLAEAKPQGQRIADNLRKTLDKVRATLEEERAKFAAGDLSKRQAGLAQKRPYADQATEQLAQEVDRTRAELKSIREQADVLRNPPKTPAERALSAYQTRLTNLAAVQAERLAYLQARLASGEITAEDLKRPKRAPIDLSKSPELVALKAKSDTIRNDIRRTENEAAYKIKSPLFKAWYRFKQVRGATVNIASSFDFSAPRQGLAAILSNLTRLVTNPIKGPGMMARPFWNMFKSWWSEKNASHIEASRKIRSEQGGGLDKIAGVEYTDLATEKFTRFEENAHSILDQWAGEPLRGRTAFGTIAGAPVKLASRAVRMSNRAFIAFLNTTRLELFEHLVKINFKERAPTEVELKAVGNLVNVATGRGSMSPKTAQVASEILWAPKLLASRVQLLTGQPFYHGTGKTRWIVAKEYGRMLAAGTVLAMVSQLFDDKNKGKPSMVSSNFGKVRDGNTTIDLWGGFQQPIVLASRFISGKRETAKGQTVEIGAKAKYGEGLWLVGTQFVRSKLRPDIGAVIDFATRKNFVGEPWTPGMAAESLFVPLPMRDLIPIMKEHGLPEGLILEVLNQFGAGISQREDKTSR